MNHRILALAALLAASLLAACGGASDDDTPVVDSRSALAFGPCAVAIADASAVCGTLTVPEDRADKSSRLIGLPFAILPALATLPARDPVVIFTGGPGPSPLRTVAELPADALQAFPLRQKRDVIVMTQRGTDLTAPQSLDCQELALDFASGERFAAEADVVAAAKACRDRLVAAGARLGTYTTKTIARDMEDLRVLLGAERGFTQWNLVGSSYGSKLALATMRDAPAGVRSAVLDGPFPLQERELYGARVLNALSAVLGACNAQPDCAAAYPGLQARFASAIERLETAPAVVQGTPVRGHQLLNVLRAALAVPRADYGKLPLFMEHVARGELVEADAVLPFLSSLVLAINPEGMFYTVTCIDDAGLTTAASNELPPDGTGWPDAVRQLVARNGLGLQARTCPLWTQGVRLSTDVLRPLRSDIPALITVGQFDAPTPATSADMLLADLTRARKVVFTGRGHGLLESDTCMLTVVAAFLDDPLAAPDTSCVDTADSLRFVTPATLAAQKRSLQTAVQDVLRTQPLIPSMLVQIEHPAMGLTWSGAAGVVDRLSQAPVTTETVFRIASVTKTFTSAATHRLAELGRLQLGDPIADHLLPETVATLRERGYEPDRITVTHLLAHTSGLPNYDTPQYQAAVLADPKRRWTRRAQMLFALDRFPLVGAPGEVFEYADTGYNLLGEIIEAKTGTSLGAAYRSLLNFDGLGMRSTWMEADESAPGLPAGFAHAYGDNGLDLRDIDPSADTHGGGGLVSSVGDLTRFFRALLEGRVVQPQSLLSMQTEFVTGSGLGRGLFLLSADGQTCWGHEGFWGVGAYYCPQTRVSVALAINLALADEANQARPALSPFLNAVRLINAVTR
jgi:D-alanyl-D-alanine carboxypeptidase